MFHVRFAVSMFILHENPHQFGKYDVILKYHELSTFIMPELLTNNQFQPWLTENPLRFHNQLLKNHGLEGQEPAFKYAGFWLLKVSHSHGKFHHHRPDQSTSRPKSHAQSNQAVDCIRLFRGRLLGDHPRHPSAHEVLTVNR